MHGARPGLHEALIEPWAEGYGYRWGRNEWHHPEQRAMPFHCITDGGERSQYAQGKSGWMARWHMATDQLLMPSCVTEQDQEQVAAGGL
jgi:hypothetical protein